jgi:hypothetical protein
VKKRALALRINLDSRKKKKKKTKMRQAAPFFFLAVLLPHALAQSTYAPCVPVSRLSSLDTSTRQLVRGGAPKCCRLSSGLVSCASTEDGDGVVIDLDVDQMPEVPNMSAGDAAPQLAATDDTAAGAAAAGAAAAKGGTVAKLSPEMPTVTIRGDLVNRLGDSIFWLSPRVERPGALGHHEIRRRT